MIAGDPILIVEICDPGVLTNGVVSSKTKVAVDPALLYVKSRT